VRFQYLFISTKRGGDEMIGLNVVITRGGDFGWTSPLTLGLIVATLIAMFIFIKIEIGKSHALVDFKLFKNKPYTGATISNFLLNAVAGTLVVANTYVQVGRGFTAFQSGMLSIGYLVAVLVMIRVGEKILQKSGARRPMIAGSILAAIGIGAMALTFLPDVAYVIVVFVGFILFGIGLVQPKSPPRVITTFNPIIVTTNTMSPVKSKRVEFCCFTLLSGVSFKRNIARIAKAMEKTKIHFHPI